MARILLVEDDKATRELYETLLKEAGHQVDVAEDGEIGFAKAIEGGYDLIILDIILPKKDGIIFLEELKKTTPKKENKKIVMLTNLDKEDFIKAALRLGADGYLMKPTLKPKEVLAEVKAYLKQEN